MSKSILPISKKLELDFLACAAASRMQKKFWPHLVVCSQPVSMRTVDKCTMGSLWEESV